MGIREQRLVAWLPVVGSLLLSGATLVYAVGFKSAEIKQLQSDISQAQQDTKQLQDLHTTLEVLKARLDQNAVDHAEIKDALKELRARK